VWLSWSLSCANRGKGIRASVGQRFRLGRGPAYPSLRSSVMKGTSAAEFVVECDEGFSL
jgi:hypothetical protein